MPVQIEPLARPSRDLCPSRIFEPMDESDFLVLRQLAKACICRGRESLTVIPPTVASFDLVNYSPLRPGRKIMRIDGAYALLGPEWLSRIALTHRFARYCRALHDATGHDATGEGNWNEPPQSWSDAVTYAFSSELIARVSGQASPGLAWMSGMLLGMQKTLEHLNSTPDMRDRLMSDRNGTTEPVGIEKLVDELGLSDRLPPPSPASPATDCPWRVALLARRLTSEGLSLATTAQLKCWPRGTALPLHRELRSLARECHLFARACWRL